MKKKFFGIVLVMMLLIAPIRVNAATNSVFASPDEGLSSTTENNKTIECSSESPTNTSNIRVCYIAVDVGIGTVNNFEVTATLTGLTYDDYDAMNGWSLAKPTVSGNKVTFKFSNKTGVSSGYRKAVAKVYFKADPNAQKCSIGLGDVSFPNEPSNPTCKVEGDKYYCKNALECTKEEYEKECIPENPQTGSFLPYAIILAGLGVAGAFYFTTRKKAKIYHV